MRCLHCSLDTHNQQSGWKFHYSPCLFYRGKPLRLIGLVLSVPYIGRQRPGLNHSLPHSQRGFTASLCHRFLRLIFPTVRRIICLWAPVSLRPGLRGERNWPEARGVDGIYGLLKTSLYTGQTRPQGKRAPERPFCAPCSFTRMGLPAGIGSERKLAGALPQLGPIQNHLGS